MRTTDEQATEYLRSKGWTETPAGQWYRPNWDFDFDQRQREDYEARQVPLEPGCYTTLRRAERIQWKLDSMDEVPSLEAQSADTAV